MFVGFVFLSPFTTYSPFAFFEILMKKALFSKAVRTKKLPVYSPSLISSKELLNSQPFMLAGNSSLLSFLQTKFGIIVTLLWQLCFYHSPSRIHLWLRLHIHIFESFEHYYQSNGYHLLL